MKLLEQRISDRRVLKLIRKWLKAGIMEEGKLRNSITGTPQGGVISPLLANIYLNTMDRLWEKKFSHLGKLIRYAELCGYLQEETTGTGKCASNKGHYE